MYRWHDCWCPQARQKVVYAQVPPAPSPMVAPEASSEASSESVEEEEQGPAYYGLDDSDLEEWLESSAATSVAGALGAPQLPKLTVAVTAIVQRGAREGPGGDACRQVPPNRWVPPPKQRRHVSTRMPHFLFCTPGLPSSLWPTHMTRHAHPSRATADLTWLMGTT